jgi:integrase
MKFHPSEPRPYHRRGVRQPGRWEVDLRGTLDNGLEVKRERRVFPINPATGKIGKRQAAAQAYEEWQRWNRHGQVLRPGETPVLPRTGGMKSVPTFAQFAPDFLDFCASINAGPNGAHAPASLDVRRTSIRKHLLPALGQMQMDQLHRRDVDRYIIQKTKEGRSPNSIRTDLSVLRRMFSVALSYEVIQKIPDFKLPTEAESDVEALDPEEALRFRKTIAELYEPRRALLLELYLRAGLRCGEALALFPADFNLDVEHPTVWVCRSWGRRGYGPTKGRKSRLVPLVRDLAPRLDALLSERRMSRRSTTEHPFSSELDSKRPLGLNRAEHLVRRAGERAQTRPLHPHMLRHTFGTDCARRGVPVLTIQEWMGHKDVQTTMRYLHLVTPDHLRHADLLSD